LPLNFEYGIKKPIIRNQNCEEKNIARKNNMRVFRKRNHLLFEKNQSTFDFENDKKKKRLPPYPNYFYTTEQKKIDPIKYTQN